MSGVAELIAKRKAARAGMETQNMTPAPTPPVAAPVELPETGTASKEVAKPKRTPRRPTAEAQLPVPQAGPAKASPFELEDWEAELLANVSEEGASLKEDGVPWIQNSKSGLVRPGYETAEEIPIFVVGWAFENALYDRPYDPDNPTIPLCYAIAKDPEKLAPDDVPAEQSTSCGVCEFNEWGSDARGKGKACRNLLRLVVMDRSDNSIWRVKISPTGLKRAKNTLAGMAKRGPVPLFEAFLIWAEIETYSTVAIRPGAPVSDPEVVRVITRAIKDHGHEVLQHYDNTKYMPFEEKTAPKQPKRAR